MFVPGINERGYLRQANLLPPKHSTSEVWKFFGFTHEDGKITRAHCMYCACPIELISRPLTSSNILLQPLHLVFGTGAWNFGAWEPWNWSLRVEQLLAYQLLAFQLLAYQLLAFQLLAFGFEVSTFGCIGCEVCKFLLWAYWLCSFGL